MRAERQKDKGPVPRRVWLLLKKASCLAGRAGTMSGKGLGSARPMARLHVGYYNRSGSVLEMA
jgi:hypothetical protein